MKRLGAGLVLIVASMSTYSLSNEEFDEMLKNLREISDKRNQYVKEHIREFQNLDGFNEIYERDLTPHGKPPRILMKHDKRDEQKKKVEEPKVTFKDIIGLDAALIEVREIVDFLKNPKKYKAMGAQLPKGILFEGPPGNGKTLIAKAIANEAGCNFIYQSASSFVEKYVGVGAKRVRELFAKAREGKPTLIFIDEIDAIGNREADGNSETRQTINQLLCELDGFEASDDIIIIAATNYVRLLDKALTRAGRFDRIVKIPAPDLKAREEILQYYLKKLPKKQASSDFIKRLAMSLGGLSSSDLKVLVNEAALLAVRDNALRVEERHIEAAAAKIIDARMHPNK